MKLICLLVIIYISGMFGFALYNKEIGLVFKLSNTSCNDRSICKEKFNTIIDSSFTMLQAVTGDSWMEGYLSKY